jgi:hypothetical protein
MGGILMSVTLQSTISRNPDYVTNEIDGSLAMMSLSTNAFHGLNVVGATIWAFLAKPASVEAIVAHILDRFEVSEQECQRDVLSFVEEMLDRTTILIN